MKFCKERTDMGMSMKKLMEEQPLPQNIIITDTKNEYKKLQKQLVKQQPGSSDEIIDHLDIHIRQFY